MSNSRHSPAVAVTAGLRGAMWNPDKMRAPYNARSLPSVTADGQSVQGILYQRQPGKRVAIIMHPREFVLSHYLVPYILDAGWACWVQGARSIGNDLRLEHELALLDVAAGLTTLRAEGFESIVLVGNSGGAGLFAFYNQQSQLAPELRLRRTPSGRPVNLAGANMPVADGVILVSPHPGQGILLMNCLDPSVVDEGNPLLTDPELDPFRASNGFRKPPESSAYNPEFIQRYRQGQRRRVERLDRLALEMVQKKQQARTRIKAGEASAEDRLTAAHAPIFQVWRTDADLRCWDTSLDPSDRLVGSLWGSNPMISNYGSVGFGRTVTPESWLSTWSGLSSNASMEKCADSIHQPTLVVEYTGDNCVFPSDLKQMLSQIPAQQKQHLSISGNHHGQAIYGDGPVGQELCGAHLTQWLGDLTF